MDQKVFSATTSLFIQKNSVLIRIWHWLTFITVSALMITVLMASTVLHPRANIKMVVERLENKGVTITDDQAFSVSHAYDDKMWDIHKLLGYGLSFLLLSRLLIEAVQKKEEKLRTRILKVLKLKLQDTESKKELKHFLIVKRGYIVFYVLLLVIVLTGLGMIFGHDLTFLDQNHRLIKKIHGFCQYLMYAYVFFHLCGVIIADNTNAKGIVSGIINGNKEN
jgi:Ni/Fe-hydrogenase 1 B-type cytochrome subunit